MLRAHWTAIPILFLLLLTLNTASAEELTLDDCIEMALKQNQDVIRARNSVKNANANVWTAFGDFLPNLNVSLNTSESHAFKQSFTTYDAVHEVDTSILLPPNDSIFSDHYGIASHYALANEYEIGGMSKAYSFGGSAQMILFNGGSNIFNYLGAKADKKYYKYLAEETEQGLIFGVKVSYYAYLSALDQMEIAQEAVKRGEEQHKLANSKYEVGSASKSDVLKATVQFGNDKLGLMAAENRVKTTLADLKYLIGLDVNSETEISRDYEPKEYSGSEGEALKFGLANHPGLLATEYNVRAAKYDVRSTFGTYLPTFSVSLSKSWTNTTWKGLKELNNEDASWTFGTTLSYPIFTGFSRKRNMTRAKVILNNARAELHNRKNDIALKIKESYLEINRSREALKVAEETVLAANEDMSLVQEKYNLGAATILELLDAQVSLITAQITKITAEFDYNLAVAGLEKATGIR